MHFSTSYTRIVSMRKRIIILFLLNFGQSVQGMEECEQYCGHALAYCFSLSKSHIYSWFVGTPLEESLRIQVLRTAKYDFEQNLYVSQTAYKKHPDSTSYAWSYFADDIAEGTERWCFNLLVKPFFKEINADPLVFLQYCYGQKYHTDKREKHLSLLVTSVDLLNRCKEARIDGYSALGAAIIAKSVRLKDRCTFVRRLMQYGFEMTEEDRVLSALELYDAISTEHKEKMVLFLCDHKESGLSMLPHDIMKHIVHCAVQVFKENMVFI